MFCSHINEHGRDNLIKGTKEYFDTLIPFIWYKVV